MDLEELVAALTATAQTAAARNARRNDDKEEFGRTRNLTFIFQ